jgi:hypothetical protein
MVFSQKYNQGVLVYDLVVLTVASMKPFFKYFRSGARDMIGYVLSPEEHFLKYF